MDRPSIANLDKIVKDLDNSSARYPTPTKKRKLNPQQKMKKRIVKLTLQKLG